MGVLDPLPSPRICRSMKLWALAPNCLFSQQVQEQPDRPELRYWLKAAT